MSSEKIAVFVIKKIPLSYHFIRSTVTEATASMVERGFFMSDMLRAEYNLYKDIRTPDARCTPGAPYGAHLRRKNGASPSPAVRNPEIYTGSSFPNPRVYQYYS